MKKLLKKLLGLSFLDIYERSKFRRRNIARQKQHVKILSEFLNKKGKKKIQIGSGSNIIEGWLNTDIRDEEGILYLDAGKEFPLPDDSVDFIFSEHLFEHLTVNEQINMLKESYRILKSGGVMRIATPTLDFLFDLYRNPETSENSHYVKWAINGGVSYLKDVRNNIKDGSFHYPYVINNFFKAWGHQMIHNFGSLKDLALQLGYSEVIESKVRESSIPELKGLERHGTIIPSEINLKETMVVEIFK